MFFFFRILYGEKKVLWSGRFFFGMGLKFSFSRNMMGWIREWLNRNVVVVNSLEMEGLIFGL